MVMGPPGRRVASVSGALDTASPLKMRPHGESGPASACRQARKEAATAILPRLLPARDLPFGSRREPSVDLQVAAVRRLVRKAWRQTYWGPSEETAFARPEPRCGPCR